jgi:DNA-directed RNA polymerase specialized sigma24 family protein
VRSVAADDTLSRLESHRRALDAVSALPEPYRSTVVNCCMDGLAPAALARRLGVSADTVEARLRDALRLLDGRFRTRRDA